ncbi:MAG: hypothetical protein ACYC1J_08470 [Acidithiobacillus ferrooxidans]
MDDVSTQLTGGPSEDFLAKYLVSAALRTGPWWLWRHVFIL